MATAFLLFAATICSLPYVKAISLSEFYPFGENAGDQSQRLYGYYIHTPPIQANVTRFPYFGKYHETFFIGSGYIVFNTSSSYYVIVNSGSVTSTSGQNLDVIVPFWFYGDYFYYPQSDRNRVLYRTTTERSTLDKARRDIQRAFSNHDDFQPLWLLIATWENTDIDSYYYDYDYDADDVNFQSVLVTDGLRSFAIFYYDERSLYDSSIDIGLYFTSYLHMGFNTTDGVNQFFHPQSFSRNITNVFNTSNVGRPGVWIFRLDTLEAPSVGCTPQAFAPIFLVPNVGNMLGGTAVRVIAPCLNQSDVINCIFDSTSVRGTFLDESSLLCISPSLQRAGRLRFQLTVEKTVGEQKTFVYGSTFTSVSPDRGHVVDIETTSLMFKSGDTFYVNWNPQDLLPSQPPGINSSSLLVSIYIYHQTYEYLIGRRWGVEWVRGKKAAASNILNEEGRAEIVLNKKSIVCRYPLLNGISNTCPFVVKVTVDSQQQLPSGIGIWSGVAFLQNRENSSKDNELREFCDRWSDLEESRNNGGETLLTRVLSCPPTISLAISDPNFEVENYRSIFRSTQYSQQRAGFLHPSTSTCFVQVTPSQGSGHQCCYSEAGNLVLGAPGGGSADLMSPKEDFNRHLSDDILPYVLCCKEVGANCAEFYRWRPSNARVPYVFPIPACIYGDPHVITLDGLKYTFNGKGEFTMIDTTDNSFTLQGRMDTIQGPDGEDIPGTVFTALVAREEDTNTTVQFNLRSDKIDILANGEAVTFEEDTQIILDKVTFEDSGNSTVSVNFAGGAKIELRVENGIISVMLITLPNEFKGMTRGLMGSFNGNVSDDLIPKSQSKPLSVNASIEEIHKNFGITWIIDSEADSLFTYDSESGESWAVFYSPNFSPAFQPTFANASLEQQAREVCGDNEYCLFDVAATKNVDIGMATMQGVNSFDTMVEMAAPIVCDPPCVNGACVKNDTCSCSEGFKGITCSTPVVTECDVNPCENNGTCMQHVLTYTCDCPDGFIGAFCQEKEPPFHIRLLNGSPRVSGQAVLIDFETTMPIITATCFLTGQRQRRCGTSSTTNGRVRYINLPAGSYVFRVQAQSFKGEKASVRRIVHVGESGDKDFCAVHLINEGVNVDGRSASFFFQGTEPVTSYFCRLSSNTTDTRYNACRSPTRFDDLSIGEYRFQVIPAGCDKGKRVSVKFTIF